MSWDGTEGVPRFYMFSEDSASAYVLRHQTSTVLEFWVRDRGFGGLDGEFEGQCFGTHETIGVRNAHAITKEFLP